MLLAMRALLGIAGTLLLLVLAACSGPGPELALVPEGSSPLLKLTSEDPSGTFTVRNGGAQGSVLSWSVRSSSPYVIATPASGAVRAGELGQTVEVTVEQGRLTRGEVLRATLEVRSNGGNASLEVEFEMQVDGLAACGSYPRRSGLGQGAEDGAATLGSAAAKAPAGAFVPGELLVQLRPPGITTQSLDERGLEAQRAQFAALGRELAQRYDLTLLKAASPLRAGLVALPSGSGAEETLETAARLSADPQVAYAEPNYYLEPLALPDDPLVEQQWHLLEFGLPQAWAIDPGRNPVTIAIIDSGVDMLHEDLVDKMLPGCDFHDGDNDPNPGSASGKAAHGTHVAGIAAAVGDNGVGVASVAYGPGVKLLPVKVFDDTGMTGTVDDLLDAMLWAAGFALEGVGANPNPAKVINMSLGVEPSSLSQATLRAIDEVAQRVYQRGAVLFAASGNRGWSDHVLAPASSPWVYAVGSVDADRELSSFSNYNASGPTVEFVAPGGSSTSPCWYVLSTYPDDGYRCEGGTSMASPFVAGTAALLLSQTPGLTPAQLLAKLKGSAYFDGSYMTAAAYGAGIVCPDKALGASTRCGR